MGNIETPPFHLAIPVDNLEKNRIFYREVLGLNEGRKSESWADFNFFGHQLVLHQKNKSFQEENARNRNTVNGQSVPIPHFGVVLPWDVFYGFYERLKKENVTFVIEPAVRFEGKKGEQVTMFFCDPAGNALEFKAFKDINQLFEK